MAGAKRVIGVDMDERCIHALEDYLVPASGGRLTLIKGDALAIKEETLTDDKIKIVANLPYNVASPLLFKWLDNIKRFESLTLMFQKEVAERICAAPGSKDYGRMAVMAQWLCYTHKEFDISPKAFFPPPKVTSSVVSFIPRERPLAEADKKQLESLCKAVFNQRRKMLRKSLQQLTSDPEAVLQEAGIAPEERPENLSIEAFCRLVRALKR
jgi:16S rRNA (adenine1518-N6/adenine1519-N6)-dimethyltransferase